MAHAWYVPETNMYNIPQLGAQPTYTWIAEWTQSRDLSTEATVQPLDSNIEPANKVKIEHDFMICHDYRFWKSDIMAGMNL